MKLGEMRVPWKLVDKLAFVRACRLSYTHADKNLKAIDYSYVLV